jgi:hypothetical protein
MVDRTKGRQNIEPETGKMLDSRQNVEQEDSRMEGQQNIGQETGKMLDSRQNIEQEDSRMEDKRTTEYWAGDWQNVGQSAEC